MNRIIRHINVLLSSMLILTMISCLSEINFSIPENNLSNISIVGRLVEGNPSIVNVRISGLSNFIGFNQGVPVTGAEVTLLDQDGNSVTIPEGKTLVEGVEKLTGEYQREIINELTINIGEQYKIQAIVNGITYESSFETLSAVPIADSISFKVAQREVLNDADNIVTQNFIQFFIHTPLAFSENSTKAYLKWDFEGVYRLVETTQDLFLPPPVRICFLTQLLNNSKIVVYNGPESLQEYLAEELLLEELLNHRFSQGFYLNVAQQSLSKGAYEYWNNIRSITDLSGNFFEDPPGKVLGNFTNTTNPNEEVFGYFYASQVDTVRLYIHPAGLGVRSKCPSIGSIDDINIEPSCFDCQSLNNSTTKKPYYWTR